MSQTIDRIIRHNYIRSALVPILVIEVMLIVLYFGINTYITDKFSELTLQESKNNLQEVINGQAGNIDLQLNEISRSLRLLRDEQQAILSAPARSNDAVFDFTSGGAWVKQQDNGGSAVIVSSVQTLSDAVKAKVLQTEGFDRVFKAVTDHNPRVVATYFTSRYHMTRYYPYFDGIESVLPENYDINNYNFYYEANPDNNPDKEIVWTGAYLDPAGQGWMVSGLVPIYANGEFEGTTGIDVTIDSLVSKVLNLELPYQSSAFLLDDKGTVLAMPEDVEKVFMLKELKSHDYTESIEGDVLKPEDYNLLKHQNPEIREAAQALLSGEQTRSYFVTESMEGFYLYKSPVALTGWQLMVLVPENAIKGPVHTLEGVSMSVGYLALAGMVVFYALFFAYLIRNAHRTAADLSQPVEELAKSTVELGKSTRYESVKTTGITELDQLATNFNDMAHQLTARTEQLIRSEIQRRENESRANTDYLTGLYNRRYFTEHVQTAWDKVTDRENILLVIDIDLFKGINDQYGHDVGDEVLTGCSHALKQVVGERGLVARIGGEEFAVYCTLSYQQAMDMAEEIRAYVERQCYTEKALKVTLSIGLDASVSRDFKASFALADKALYCAKNSGRNRVLSSEQLIGDSSGATLISAG